MNVGDVLAGKYRIEKVLGIGGMGMVLAAMHLELEQRVAIKMMLPDVMRTPQHVERFLREAKNAVKLRNEHVCRVIDVSKAESGAPFIVMEFMDGRDLSDLLAARGPLPVDEAVDYLLQAIEGIAEAHANHIVHRDLKPQNLFVLTDSDGSPLVKVLDFGISKSAVGGSATKTGDIMGSPSYMAPEQMMSAKDVDGRADVWALGVILYQALTGQLPFDGESLPVLCMSVMHDQPLPATTHRPDLPASLNTVIMRCLEKPLQQRFPNVGALAKALAPFGRPGAVTTADRIQKMLARSSSPIVVPSHNAFASTVAATTVDVHAGSSVQPGARPYGAISTLQASAGSMEAFSSAPGTTRVGLIVTSTLLAVAAVFGGAFFLTRRDRSAPTSAAAPATNTSPSVSAAPAPSADAAPVPAPAAVAPAPVPPAPVTAAPVEAPARNGSASSPSASPVAAVKTTSTKRRPAVTQPKATSSKTGSAEPAPITSKTTPETVPAAPAYDPLSRRTRDTK